MTFTKIGLGVSAGYLVLTGIVEGILGQIGTDMPSPLWHEIIQQGGTIASLSLVLYFSWRHHLSTVKYYRERLREKEDHYNKMVIAKDEEIKRLNEKINGK